MSSTSRRASGSCRLEILQPLLDPGLPRAFMRDVVLDGGGKRLFLRLLDENGPVRPVPGRDWCPHQSWREMHQGWMFSIQSK